MGRIVKVDWDELKRVSKKFDSYAQEIDKTSKSLRTSINSVKDNWKGADANNFVQNCENLLNSLSNEAIYLRNWHTYLNTVSEAYKENVEKAASVLIDVEDYL